LPRAGPDAGDEEIADSDPERDAEGQLDDAANRIRGRGAESDDRRDRREERTLVPDRVVGERPREPAADRRLDDRIGELAERVDARRNRDAQSDRQTLHRGVGARARSV
jgi:hypothetical protein